MLGAARGAWLTARMAQKKSETIEVRLQFETKRAFVEACRAEGVTVSAAVRGFVEGRLARRAWPVVPLGVLAAIAGVALALPVASTPDFSAGFERLDRNRDRVVVAAEIVEAPSDCAMALPLSRERWRGGPRPFAVCEDRPAFAALDRNRDGLATVAEYAAYRRDFFHRAYASLDRNRDGTLDAEEYAQTAKTRFLPPAPRLARFEDLDRDRDGRIGWDEYIG